MVYCTLISCAHVSSIIHEEGEEKKALFEEGEEKKALFILMVLLLKTTERLLYVLEDYQVTLCLIGLLAPFYQI